MNTPWGEVTFSREGESLITFSISPDLDAFGSSIASFSSDLSSICSFSVVAEVGSLCADQSGKWRWKVCRRGIVIARLMKSCNVFPVSI